MGNDGTRAPGRRLVELDVLRALAILLVLFHHLAWRVAKPGESHLLRAFVDISWFGVDLFFVLSGWLIGGLYFREEIRHGDVDMVRFWSRRWLRTLPPYFGVLLVTIAVYRYIGTGRTIWQEFVFLQNYTKPFAYTLSVSWSLCIEEHFYLVLPLVLTATRRRRRETALYGIPALVVAVAVARALTVYGLIGGRYHWGIVYTATHLRIDTLAIGVWLALVRWHFPDWWRAIIARARPIGLASIGILGAMIGGFARAGISTHGSAFIDIAGFTAIGLAFGGLLVYALAEGSLPSRVPAWLATPVAVSSYSTYLAHFPVLVILAEAWKTYPALGATPGARLASGGILVALVTWASYRLFEKPAIRLRDRLVPARRVPVVHAEEQAGTGRMF